MKKNSILIPYIKFLGLLEAIGKKLYFANLAMKKYFWHSRPSRFISFFSYVHVFRILLMLDKLGKVLFKFYDRIGRYRWKIINSIPCFYCGNTDNSSRIYAPLCGHFYCTKCGKEGMRCPKCSK